MGSIRVWGRTDVIALLFGADVPSVKSPMTEDRFQNDEFESQDALSVCPDGDEE
jgi:hypothetical protein